MKNYFELSMEPGEIRAISSIALAHLGDAVYEVLVRAWLCAHGKATGKGMHRATVALVCAPEQARRAERILSRLTEEEHAVFRRGRNAHVNHVPKSASVADYHAATAFEALFGYLYLSGKTERLRELFAICMEE